MLPVTIAIPLIQSAAGALNKPNDKDPARFASAENWYVQAVQGDTLALCQLKYMGGRRGAGSCGGQAAAGFATSVAKDYTESLYQQALQVLAGTTPPSAPFPDRPGASSTGAGPLLATGSELLGAAATGLGSPPGINAQQQLSTALTVGKWALLIGGVAVLAFLVLRARR